MKHKKTYLIIIFFISVLFLTSGKINNKIKKNLKPLQTSGINSEGNKSETTSLFIPYWSVPSTIPTKWRIPSITKSPYLIYFGISPNENGINKADAGFIGLSKFAAISGNNKTFLTLRMTNLDINLKILADKSLQERIIEETTTIAKQNGFEGIILDLELSSLSLASTSSQITDFVKLLSKKTKEQNMNFAMTIYGDTLYRVRPYDLAKLNSLTDHFFIMMYDFSKPAGEPGPNFPLHKGNKFAYSIEVATKGFLKLVPPEKITIIFGLYGYDWAVAGPQDERPLERAKAITLKQIKAKFINSCNFKPCDSIRDTTASENKIKYVDSDGQNHIVWYEDEKSVEEKILFLKSKGITNFSFWAWGYY